MNGIADVSALLSQGVAAPTRWRNDAPIAFEKQRFLIVDDQQISRDGLRLTIQAMGGTSVAMVGNQGEAMYQLRNSQTPSIILCDYNLGKGRNGQQLLEEVRLGGLIPEETIFMMVTAERAYEKVVAAVELAPDDYILKPFTPEALRLRLDRLVRKKLFFTRFYGHKRGGNIDAAIAQLEAMESGPGGATYRFEIMRSRAETLLHAGRIAEARVAYESILGHHPFPWAKAGLARCLSAQEENLNARTLLDEVIQEAPDYLDALDLQASVCTALGDYAEAQRVLARGVERNPNNWRRQRTLSDAAVANGDMETARKAMDSVIRLATTPGALGPADLIAMARLQAEKGDKAAAAATLAQISEAKLQTLDNAQRLSLIAVRAVIDPTKAAEEFAAQRPTFLAMEQPSADLGIDVVYAALGVNDLELAVQFAERLLSCDGTLKTFQPLLSGFRKHGQEETLRQIQKDAARKLIERQHRKRA